MQMYKTFTFLDGGGVVYAQFDMIGDNWTCDLIMNKPFGQCWCLNKYVLNNAMDCLIQSECPNCSCIGSATAVLTEHV